MLGFPGHRLEEDHLTQVGIIFENRIELVHISNVHYGGQSSGQITSFSNNAGRGNELNTDNDEVVVVVKFRLARLDGESQ